ncbi:ribose-phosphate pyrophosphokinase [Candidatus Microgenomates bacterium]|nr:ribose-phosphate pyrophosphokinase [Candidatus Microgenomates bacterium]
MIERKLMLVSGNANRPLAAAIAKKLGIELIPATVGEFADGETQVKIDQDIRGGDVFVIQSTSPPVNQNLMELLIMIDALKRASAERITAVIPYFGYSRQDRKDQPRVPITAKLAANLITTARADRVLTLDLHAHQIQGFFDIPLDHLYAVNQLVTYLKRRHLRNPVIASADVGGVKMARRFAAYIGADLAVVDKRRIDSRQTEVMNILGEVAGRDVLIVDDICATGGSLVEAAAALRKVGARKVYAAVSHGLLVDDALTKIESSVLEELWITDSVFLPKSKRTPKIKVISIAQLLAEAVKRIHHDRSISALFKH